MLLPHLRALLCVTAAAAAAAAAAAPQCVGAHC